MVRVFIAGPYSDIRHNGSVENNMLAARAATETLLKWHEIPPSVPINDDSWE